MVFLIPDSRKNWNILRCLSIDVDAFTCHNNSLKYMTLDLDPDHDFDLKCDRDTSSHLGDIFHIWPCCDLDHYFKRALTR